MSTATTATTTTQTFLLPDVGEGLTEADIVTWHVAVGDTVGVNQTIVAIETAKSLVELPSPYAGTVVELLVAEGETAAVGSHIIAIASVVPGTGAAGRTADAARRAEEPQLLVGYGARDQAHRRRRRAHPASPTMPSALPAAAQRNPPLGRPRATPPVRRLARDLGVDLHAVDPTGPDGTIVRDDVLHASRAAAGTVATRPVATAATPSTAVAGETRIPIKGVRRQTALAMVSSAFTAPHVTEFVTVDVTRTLELRDVVQARREFRDVKLTVLAFVARAYLRALSATPMATARWDEDAQEIVVRAGVNLGIAAATPRGLLVPNLKDAHLLGLLGLATGIAELAATARAGRTPPEALTGGSTTITNLGVFGIDTGTPILNPGETAILAVGAVRRQPWVVEDGAGERIEPRSVVQLALSFDHRVLDGAEGSRVLADTAALLAEPGLALL